MSNLQAMTETFNAIAKEAGMPQRDKRFGSYEAATETIDEARATIKARREAKRAYRAAAIKRAVEKGLPQTAAEKLTKCEHFQLDSLHWIIEQGKEQNKKLAASIASDALYALQWAEGAAKAIIKQRQAQEIIAAYERHHATHTLSEVIAIQKDSMRDSLLSNQYRGGSTSEFSNALDAARREALAELAGRYGSL